MFDDTVTICTSYYRINNTVLKKFLDEMFWIPERKLLQSFITTMK